MIKMKRNKNKNEEVIINVDATDGHDVPEQAEEPKTELVDKPKKRKGFAKLFSTFNLYKFIVKIVATILLLTFGIIILIYRDSTALFALYIITGGVAVFQALIRTIFLFKKTRNPRAKIVTGIELIIEFVVGAFFIFAAFAQFTVNNDSDHKASQFIYDFVKFANENYPLFAAILFYVGSMSYFWRTILLNDTTDKFKFWMNFTLITGAVVLAAFRKDWSAIVIAIIIAVLCLLSALVIGGEAVGGYIIYRRETRPVKEDKKEEEKGIEAPAKDDEKDYNDIDPNAIPKEEPTTDSDIVS